jgi:hypothetical protein
MKVGFFHVDRGDTPHRALAARLIASVRRAMPDVAIAHLTDARTAPIAGVDHLVVRPSGPIALNCLEHYAGCEGEWLLVDTDVLIQRDVREVFARDRAFDIAVADRDGTLLPHEIGTKFMARMPYNKGAVFSRSPEFWRAATERLRQLSHRRQEWMGDQEAMCDVIAAGAFKVAVLPAAYNYPPKRRDEDVSAVSILHFKGSRKAWMLSR